MIYQGEHIWAGQFGHALVIISFITALAICCMSLLNQRNKTVLNILITLHTKAVVSIAGLLLFMLLKHYYEYQYVWQHSNSDMDLRFIFSCLWEGQEGSFILWLFWNAVLILILNRQLRQSEFQFPVLAIMYLIQAFISSMLLGVYLFDFKIGSSPFLLLREHPDFMNLPFIKSANYLSSLNGRGLNPLLMNAWMTIHPPTLFLGFALTGFPFAFSVSSLWNNIPLSYWSRKAYPWAIAATAVLGIGILMGGAWAYEALSFGGFWAWDPVENSSLVPWLLMVAGSHALLLVIRKKSNSTSFYWSNVLPFITVLYSTFLTRSGILGNASVHAFTDLGMTGQLLIYLLTFIFLAVTPAIQNTIAKASYMVLSPLLFFITALFGVLNWGFWIWTAYTCITLMWQWAVNFFNTTSGGLSNERSVWMRMGIFLLFLSSMVILFFTSVPVLNSLLDKHYAPPALFTYNQWTAPLVMLIVLCMTWSYQLKYLAIPWQNTLFQVRWPLVISVLLSFCIVVPFYFLNPPKGIYGTWYWQLVLCFLVVILVGSIILHLTTPFRSIKLAFIKSGGTWAHIGFVLVILGAVLSTSKKTSLVSAQQPSVPGIKTNSASIMLSKGDTVPLGPYWASYIEKKRVGMDVFFKVEYFSKNNLNKYNSLFALYPKVQDNPRMGKAADPDTRHFLSHDVYTHITYADVSTQTQNSKGYSEPVNMVGHIGDTLSLSRYLLVFDSVRTELNPVDSALKVTAVLRGIDVKGAVFKAYPYLEIKNRMIQPASFELKSQGIKVLFWNIRPQENQFEFTVQENTSLQKDYIVMEAYAFPLINILWLGVIVMGFGTFLALINYLTVKQ